MRKLLIAIQRFLRRVLNTPSRDEIQQLATDLERKLNARVAVAESRIKAKSKELEQIEAQMQRLATDMTLALYDAVETIKLEIVEAKKEINNNDKG